MFVGDYWSASGIGGTEYIHVQVEGVTIEDDTLTLTVQNKAILVTFIENDTVITIDDGEDDLRLIENDNTVTL